MSLCSPQAAHRGPKIARAFTPPQRDMYVVQLHEHDCSCGACRPHVPSDSDRLTARDMGMLATIAAASVTGIMFAIDPAGTLAALLATMGL